MAAGCPVQLKPLADAMNLIFDGRACVLHHGSVRVIRGSSRALGVVISIPAALVLLSAPGASSAVPLTPGQIGVCRWVASSVLGPHKVAPEPAVLIAIGLQAMNYLVLLAWGAAGVFQLGWPEILRVLAGLPAAGGEKGSNTPADDA